MAEKISIGPLELSECPGWRDRRDALLRQCILNGDTQQGRYSSRLQKGKRHDHIAVSAVFAADGAVVSHAEIEAFVRAQTGENGWIMNQGSFQSLSTCPQIEHVDKKSWRCLALSSHMDAHWSAHWRTVLAGTYRDDRAAFHAAVNEGKFVAFQFVSGTRGWNYFTAETADRSMHRWTRLIHALPARELNMPADVENVFQSIMRNTKKKRKADTVAPEEKKKRKKKQKLNSVTKN